MGEPNGDIMSKLKYKKSVFNYHNNEVEGYEVTCNGKYLGFVAKFESATRSYWSVIDTHEGCKYNGSRLVGKPYEYASVKRWDDTREMIVTATFPLEIGLNPRWIELEKYKF